MSDPSRSRFDRTLDIDDPSAVAVSRFEHINRETDLVDAKVLAGGTLEAKSDGKRIWIGLRPDNLCGWYPCFQTGMLSLGEALEGDPLEEVEGPCPGVDLIDQALLAEATLTVERLGDSLIATWVRSLPHRTFQYEGKEHKVYRKGTRKAKGLKALEAARAALAAEEKIAEGSMLS